MKEDNFKVRSSSKKTTYAGEIFPAIPNILMRNFKAEKSNNKWLIDITEFCIPAGKVYSLPIIDCFDGAVVSWSISSRSTAELVNSMLDQALKTVNDTAGLIVNSDCGAHYWWPGWLERIQKYGLTQSMTKKDVLLTILPAMDSLVD